MGGGWAGRVGLAVGTVVVVVAARAWWRQLQQRRLGDALARCVSSARICVSPARPPHDALKWGRDADARAVRPAGWRQVAGAR